jgi:hypothetical protein
VPVHRFSVASADQRAQVLSFLDRHGPTISLSTLRAEHAGVARADLSFLRGQFRDQWSAAHPIERCELDWLRPGSVWAMDFSHPPHRIDGCYPAILNVRDLASRQQLLWLAVEREDAATVVEALGALLYSYPRSRVGMPSVTLRVIFDSASPVGRHGCQ